MTGIRRRLRAKLLADNETIPSEDDQPPLSKLPIELLESIISYLSLQDNIRASAVCRRWQAAAVSVRRANKSPWLMFTPKTGCNYEFYDPSQRKSYFLELPEVHVQCCRTGYAKDGWVLFYRTRSKQLFLFCPYTRKVIDLPILEDVRLLMVAFSSAPTCPTGCLVFTVKQVSETVVAISTCRPGEARWKTVNHMSSSPFFSSTWNKLVFCNGLFYSLSLTGWLGIYDPEKETWSVNAVAPPKRAEDLFKKRWRGIFMAEHNNDLFVMYTCSTENPVVYKLGRTSKAWMELETLNGLTLFATFLSSTSRADVLGTMRNNVYFPKVISDHEKRCVSYSLDECRYYPMKEYHDWGPREVNPFKSIWIEPPEDLSIFG